MKQNIQMPRKNILLLFLLMAGWAQAQQDPNYTLYKYNMNILNPAYAGVSDQYELNFSIRRQWVSIEDAPATQTLTFALPAFEKNFGLGLSVVHNEVFVTEETDIAIDFSYYISLTEKEKLYFGLKAGGSFLNIDLVSLDIINDPLFSENVNRFNPIVGVGVYLKGERYYITVSTPNLIRGERYESGTTRQEGKDLSHFYAGAGYRFKLSENIDLTPSLFGRFVEKTRTTVDLGATADFYDIVELGATYRIDSSVFGTLLFKLADWVDFGYAYEYGTTDIGNTSDGSHEFLLRFRLNK